MFRATAFSVAKRISPADSSVSKHVCACMIAAVGGMIATLGCMITRCARMITLAMLAYDNSLRSNDNGLAPE